MRVAVLTALLPLSAGAQGARPGGRSAPGCRYDTYRPPARATPAAYADSGTVAYVLGCSRLALRLYRVALARDSGEVRRWMDVAWALGAVGRRPEALGVYRRAARRSPRSVEALTAVAGAEWRAGRRATGECAWRRALALAPERAELAPSYFTAPIIDAGSDPVTENWLLTHRRLYRQSVEAVGPQPAAHATALAVPPSACDRGG